MPPIFKQENFQFAEGQDVPEHSEYYPLGRARNVAKYALLVEVVGASFYLAAINIDDRGTAELLSEAFLARIAAQREEQEKENNPITKYALNSEYVTHIVSPDLGG
jgi:hypothetical protein